MGGEDIRNRLERIENKIDSYLYLSNKNETDLKWVKGYIKVSVSLITAILGGLVTTILKVFVNN